MCISANIFLCLCKYGPGAIILNNFLQLSPTKSNCPFKPALQGVSPLSPEIKISGRCHLSVVTL